MWSKPGRTEKSALVVPVPAAPAMTAATAAADVILMPDFTNIMTESLRNNPGGFLAFYGFLIIGLKKRICCAIFSK